MFADDDLLMISGIQHFVYSPRQWALIHVEQIWQDNFQTYGGKELHSRVDDPYLKEKRGDLIVSRSLPVKSQELGIYGICDAVEWTVDDAGIEISGRKGKYLPTVVEYKRGKAKVDHSDELQVAAYVVCLEEMLHVQLSNAVLFYFKTRRRVIVDVNMNIRAELQATVQRMHEYFDSGYTPKLTEVDAKKKSSLDDIVPPELFKGGVASNYIAKRLSE